MFLKANLILLFYHRAAVDSIENHKIRATIERIFHGVWREMIPPLSRKTGPPVRRNVPGAFAVYWTAEEKWSIIRMVSKLGRQKRHRKRCRLWVSIWVRKTPCLCRQDSTKPAKREMQKQVRLCEKLHILTGWQKEKRMDDKELTELARQAGFSAAGDFGGPGAGGRKIPGLLRGKPLRPI